MSSNSPMQFACPHCSKQVEASSNIAGQRIPCPHCQKNLKVPGRPSTPSTVSDELDPIAIRSPELGVDEQGQVIPDLTEPELFPLEGSSSSEQGLLDPFSSDSEPPIGDRGAAAKELAFEEDFDLSDETPTGVVSPENPYGLATFEEREDELFKSTTSHSSDKGAESSAASSASSDPQTEPVAETSVDADDAQSFTMRCKVCDSVVTATMAQVGKKIKCGDCHTLLEVKDPSEPKQLFMADSSMTTNAPFIPAPTGDVEDEYLLAEEDETSTASSPNAQSGAPSQSSSQSQVAEPDDDPLLRLTDEEEEDNAEKKEELKPIGDPISVVSSKFRSEQVVMEAPQDQVGIPELAAIEEEDIDEKNVETTKAWSGQTHSVHEHLKRAVQSDADPSPENDKQNESETQPDEQPIARKLTLEVLANQVFVAARSPSVLLSLIVIAISLYATLTMIVWSREFASDAAMAREAAEESSDATDAVALQLAANNKGILARIVFILAMPCALATLTIVSATAGRLLRAAAGRNVQQDLTEDIFSTDTFSDILMLLISAIAAFMPGALLTMTLMSFIFHPSLWGFAWISLFLFFPIFAVSAVANSNPFWLICPTTLRKLFNERETFAALATSAGISGLIIVSLVVLHGASLHIVNILVTLVGPPVIFFFIISVGLTVHVLQNKIAYEEVIKKLDEQD